MDIEGNKARKIRDNIYLGDPGKSDIGGYRPEDSHVPNLGAGSSFSAFNRPPYYSTNLAKGIDDKKSMTPSNLFNSYNNPRHIQYSRGQSRDQPQNDNL